MCDFGRKLTSFRDGVIWFAEVVAVDFTVMYVSKVFPIDEVFT